ncbi:MAG TPA: TVP38/TMEM64 family protein [Acetobacteraceae bacterium]|jgi:uncharacterized membrane protein YdjX (TVP38/TMEM64 family)|nr:TVP38/TMEM64 family protein [Acetobacteraceae bacterium]
MRVLRRFWPLALPLLAVVAAWASGLSQQISWSTLARNQAVLITWVSAHPVLAPTLYMLIYAAAVFVSLPEAAVLTVAAGLLFGTASGGILAVVGSSAGAIALFLAVRYQVADAIAARRGRFLDAVRLALRRDGFSYLLAIRLVPAFPFWLVNLAAALSGMRLLPYAAATVLGIMPATFIYASIGAGLADVLSAGSRPDLAVIFSPRVLGPLVGLAALSLLPVVWRRWKRSGA